MKKQDFRRGRKVVKYKCGINPQIFKSFQYVFL